MKKEAVTCAICETRYAVIHKEEDQWVFCPFCGEDISEDEEELDMGEHEE